MNQRRVCVGVAGILLMFLGFNNTYSALTAVIPPKSSVGLQQPTTGTDIVTTVSAGAASPTNIYNGTTNAPGNADCGGAVMTQLNYTTPGSTIPYEAAAYAQNAGISTTCSTYQTTKLYAGAPTSAGSPIVNSKSSYSWAAPSACTPGIYPTSGGGFIRITGTASGGTCNYPSGLPGQLSNPQTCPSDNYGGPYDGMNVKGEETMDNYSNCTTNVCASYAPAPGYIGNSKIVNQYNSGTAYIPGIHDVGCSPLNATSHWQ